MKRSCFALQCSCGRWFTENNRGFKRTRCRCGRHVYRANPPLAAIGLTYLTKLIQRNLSDCPTEHIPKASGAPEYGEFCRVKRKRLVTTEGLKGLAGQFEKSMRFVFNAGYRLDVDGLDIIWNPVRNPYLLMSTVLAWHTRGRKELV